MKALMKSDVTTLFLLFLLTVGLQSGCATTTAEPEPEATTLNFCPEPRPEMCTQDYRPVCAQLSDGTWQEYSNGCNACSDENAVSYKEGKCP